MTGPVRPETARGTGALRALLRTLVTTLARSLLRGLVWCCRGLLARWRRSLRLRVVTTTLLASSAVVVVLGLFVVHRVTDGLITAKRDEGLSELNTGSAYLREQLGELSGPDDPELDLALRQAAANLARGTGSGDFAVAVQTNNQRLSAKYVPVFRPDDVTPPGPLTALIANGTVQGYQFTRTSVDGSEPRPFLVAAARVETQAGRFDLYYFFPLDDEVATVGLVQNSLTAIGALLLLLLAGIAALVTRQVVTPVRAAARTAERLSAGLLEERMLVRGEDELARLAHSFNQMAVNLQRQIVQLENLSRLQQRFTSDVSHELRTPLTTVRMAADVIHAAATDFPPALARSAELLVAEVDRFEVLLADLLEISRYDSGAAVLEPEEVDVRTLVHRTVEGLSALADRAGCQVEIDLPEQPVIAEVDPRRVERILRNLIGNAIEHGERRPVRVTLARDAEAVAVTVRDHGVGLRAGEAQAVFDRFWRADPSRARHTGGTGLGLSISREDARLHDGWLQVWGRPGRGAQFRLTLPLRRGSRLTSSPLPLTPADAGLAVSRNRPAEPPSGSGGAPGTPPTGVPPRPTSAGAPHRPTSAGVASADGSVDRGPAGSAAPR